MERYPGELHRVRATAAGVAHPDMPTWVEMPLGREVGEVKTGVVVPAHLEVDDPAPPAVVDDIIGAEIVVTRHPGYRPRGERPSSEGDSVHPSAEAFRRRNGPPDADAKPGAGGSRHIEVRSK